MSFFYSLSIRSALDKRLPRLKMRPIHTKLFTLDKGASADLDKPYVMLENKYWLNKLTICDAGEQVISIRFFDFRTFRVKVWLGESCVVWLLNRTGTSIEWDFRCHSESIPFCSIPQGLRPSLQRDAQARAANRPVESMGILVAHKSWSVTLLWYNLIVCYTQVKN